MIDIYMIKYERDGQSDTIGVYAYPSGGIGLTFTDPALVDAMGGTRALADGMTRGEAADAAQRLADVFGVLTDGEITYSGVPTDSADVD